MSEIVLDRGVLKEIEWIGRTALVLRFLDAEESVFNDLLLRGSLSTYFFKYSYDEEILEWCDFVSSIIPFYGKGYDSTISIDDAIEIELLDLYGSVSRLCELDFSRTYLSSLGNGFNIFAEYGYEELADKLDAFIAEYVRLKNE